LIALRRSPAAQPAPIRSINDLKEAAGSSRIALADFIPLCVAGAAVPEAIPVVPLPVDLLETGVASRDRRMALTFVPSEPGDLSSAPAHVIVYHGKAAPADAIVVEPEEFFARPHEDYHRPAVLQQMLLLRSDLYLPAAVLMNGYSLAPGARSNASLLLRSIVTGVPHVAFSSVEADMYFNGIPDEFGEGDGMVGSTIAVRCAEYGIEHLFYADCRRRRSYETYRQESGLLTRHSIMLRPVGDLLGFAARMLGKDQRDIARNIFPFIRF